MFNSATGHTLPDTDTWLSVYEQDPETKLLLSMVKDPSLIITNNMNKLHFVYRRYIQLHIVPSSLRNIVFIAFDANPLGGHFNTYRTMHRIRLHFWWPRMYSYIDKMIEKCAGCKLTNPALKDKTNITIRPSKYLSANTIEVLACVGHKGLFLANYAWNCLSVPGTDISRCLMVTGREWHFPIDFSNDKHLELVSRPRHLHSFAERHATLLSASRELGRILVEEHRAAHRERINALRPDPKIYEPGDHVFAQRKVHSSKSKNRVGKLEFPSTGPWIILRQLRGASYECKHSVSNKIEKFHASHLSPVPLEIIPFAPIDGPDHLLGNSTNHTAMKPTRLLALNVFSQNNRGSAFSRNLSMTQSYQHLIEPPMLPPIRCNLTIQIYISQVCGNLTQNWILGRTPISTL
eukprot:scaffold53356_cov47-Cyclotella_meneghiniana.AAC.7